MSGKFYQPEGLVQAKQMDGFFTLMTPEGEISGGKGDYAGITPDNRVFVMRGALFEALFREL